MTNVAFAVGAGYVATLQRQEQQTDQTNQLMIVKFDPGDDCYVHERCVWVVVVEVMVLLLLLQELTNQLSSSHTRCCLLVSCAFNTKKFTRLHNKVSLITTLKFSKQSVKVRFQF